MEQRMYSILVELPFLFTSVAFWNASKNRSGWMKVMRLLVTWLCSNCPLQVNKLGNCLNRYITLPVIIEVHTLWLVDKYIISRKNIHIAKLPLVLPEETKNSCVGGYNLGQNCWANCILGQHFSKHRSCTGSSLSLKAMLLCIQKKAWSLGVCGKQHWIGGRGFLSAKASFSK